jgi:hypothetical protein
MHRLTAVELNSRAKPAELIFKGKPMDKGMIEKPFTATLPVPQDEHASAGKVYDYFKKTIVVEMVPPPATV